MSELTIIESAVVVEEGKSPKSELGHNHTVSVAGGTIIALNGTSPAIIVQIEDLEQDTLQLLRAGEELFPIYRDVPGIVVVDTDWKVQGVVARNNLEEAVLQIRQSEYSAMAKDLGLRSGYTPPAGHRTAPFVYWRCPECPQSIYIPSASQEESVPTCRRHDPPLEMKKHIHPGG